MLLGREISVMAMRTRVGMTVAVGALLCFAGSAAMRAASGLVTSGTGVSGAAGVQASGQTGAQADGKTERPTSRPYAGDLSIFEYPDRDKKLHVERVMDLLGIVPGKVVADVGAGSGWFTVRAAARVGADGVVYAEDINPAAIDYITQRAAREKLSNVRPVLGSVDDTKLPAQSVDAVLILKTYHEFAHPVPLMEKLKGSLRPGAKIGIIDRNGDGTDHGVMPDVVEREMAQAGFKQVGKYDFTKSDGQDYFLIFETQ
jgi:SAM-dependent methyltransferase